MHKTRNKSLKKCFPTVEKESRVPKVKELKHADEGLISQKKKRNLPQIFDENGAMGFNFIGPCLTKTSKPLQIELGNNKL